MLRSAFSWKNAWRVRIFVLGFVVVVLGVGSQMLVNAFATGPGMLSVKVTAYASEGVMADGHWTSRGACAVSISQFPLGTIIELYNPDGSFSRQCTAEDTLYDLAFGQVSLSMPGDVDGASRWGVHYLLAHPARWGWGKGGAPHFAPAPISLPPLPAHLLPPPPFPHRPKPLC